MKRLIFVCLLFCASLAFGQADGPGGPTGSGTPSKCGRPNCTVSGTLTVSGAQAYISGSLYAGPGLPNEATTGTTNGLLAKIVNVGGVKQYKTCATTDTAMACFPVVAQRNTSTNVFTTTTGTSATTNNAYVDSIPLDSPICTFDNTAVVDHYVVASVTAAGQCHDTGSATAPTSNWIVGRAKTAGTGNQSVSIEPQIAGGAGGAFMVTFGSAGTVAAGTTKFLPLNGAQTQGAFAQAGTPVSSNKTFSLLTCFVSVAPSAGQSVTFTVFKGTAGGAGAAATGTCVISNTAKSCQDGTHSDSFNVNTPGTTDPDEVAVQVVYSATAATSSPFCAAQAQ